MQNMLAKLGIFFAGLFGSVFYLAFLILMIFSIPLSVIAIMRFTGWEWWGALIGAILIQIIPFIGQLAYVVFTILVRTIL